MKGNTPIVRIRAIRTSPLSPKVLGNLMRQDVFEQSDDFEGMELMVTVVTDKLTRAINIISLLFELAISWLKNLLGATSGKKFKLGEEIAPQLGEVNSILLFGYMGMGDAVMFEPTFRAFLQKFPNATFDLIAGTASQSVAILKCIIEEHRRKFRNVSLEEFKDLSPTKRKQLNQKLTREKYDLCIAVYTTPTQYFISAIESIPIRVGHLIRPQAWYKPRPNYLFNLARKVDQNIDEREPYRHFRLAQAVGIQSQGVLPIPEIKIPQENVDWAKDFLDEQKLDGKEIVAVHLGVSKAMQWKKWPDSNYANVFSRFKSVNRHFIFFGDRSEQAEIDIARQYVSNCSSSFAGTLNLMQVGAIIQRCKLMISNDSGLGHLSVALNVPTFRIFGPSDHYGCEPYTPNHVTLYKDLTCSPCMNLGLIKPGYSLRNCGHRNCLKLITVEEVTSAISTILK